MRFPPSFKQDFLKKWVLGLQFYGSSSSSMSLVDRKKAIKLSAEVAMASARDGKTCWSKAIIADTSKQDENKGLVRKILGREFDERVTSSLITRPTVLCNNKRVRSKKVVRRSCKMTKMNKTSCAHKKMSARSIAKRMVKRRTQVLKGLVPGGDSMDDDFSLIEETLDYMLSLQAQVDMMRRVVDAFKSPNRK